MVFALYCAGNVYHPDNVLLLSTPTPAGRCRIDKIDKTHATPPSYRMEFGTGIQAFIPKEQCEARCAELDATTTPASQLYIFQHGSLPTKVSNDAKPARASPDTMAHCT